MKYWCKKKHKEMILGIKKIIPNIDFCFINYGCKKKTITENDDLDVCVIAREIPINKRMEIANFVHTFHI